MQKIETYLQDGAHYQARAVLAHLQGMISDGIEKSWSEDLNEYTASVMVSRWENCREQGYVCVLRHKGRQLNIAWFEHRNSDHVCAVRWEQNTINAPNIDHADFGKEYKTKWDVSKTVDFAEYKEMGDWIFDELVSFWIETEVT